LYVGTITLVDITVNLCRLLILPGDAIDA
jgi:hypothetical protein